MKKTRMITALALGFIMVFGVLGLSLPGAAVIELLNQSAPVIRPLASY